MCLLSLSLDNGTLSLVGLSLLSCALVLELYYDYYCALPLGCCCCSCSRVISLTTVTVPCASLLGCARILDESVSNRLSTTADWKRSKRDLSSAEM